MVAWGWGQTRVELRWNGSAGANTSSSRSGLSQVIEQYTAVIRSYDALWSELELLDQKAWVLEPRAPTASCVYRLCG